MRPRHDSIEVDAELTISAYRACVQTNSINAGNFAALVPASRQDVIGATIGLISPLLAAILYRTYGAAVSPTWLELTRQMGMPFIAGEVAVIVWARRQGYLPSALVDRWPRFVKVLFTAFLASFWISSVSVAPDKAFSTMQNMTWIVHLLFGGAVYHLVGQDRSFAVSRLAAWLSCGLLAVGILTVIHFAFPPDFFLATDEPKWGGAVPGFISHRLFGAWSAAVAVLLLGLLWQRSTMVSCASGWLYMAFTMASGLAIWTGTRAAILAFLVGLVAVRLLSGRPANRHIYWQIAVALMFATMIGTLLNPYGDPSFMFYRGAGAYGSADEASSGRLEYWLATLDLAMERPLFGWGAGSSWWLVPGPDVRHVQPHNAFIQFFVSFGLVPTVPLVTLLGWTTWRLHRLACRVPETVPLVMTIDALLAMSMVDGMLYFARFLMLISALAATCFALGATHSRSSSIRFRSGP